MASPQSIRRKAVKRFGPQKVNFWCHVVEGALYQVGIGFVSGAEVLPLLVVTRLGASNMTLGLLNTLVGTACIVPLLFAHRMEAVRRKKKLVLLLGVADRLPYLVIAAVLMLFAVSAPGVCLVAIALCMWAGAMAMNATFPPWTDLLAETIPHDRTGRLFGYGTFFSSLAGLATGPACAAVIATLAFPGNYAVLYLACFTALTLSWLIFALVDEVPEEIAPPQRQPAGDYLRDLLANLRRDRNYRMYLFYGGLKRAAFAAGPFYAVAAAVYQGMSAALVVVSLMVARRLATMIAALAGPFLAERVSHKRIMQVGTLLGGLAALMAAFAPAGAWALYVGAIFLGSLGGAAAGVSSMAFALRIYPRGRRVGYSTFSMVALTPVAMVAAPMAGWLMDKVGHTVLFSLAAAATLCALLPLGRCASPE